LTKKVIGSFKVDLNEVRARVKKSSREENLPSNKFVKAHKIETKLKGKMKDTKSDIVGWTEISEEQDFASRESLLSGMIFPPIKGECFRLMPQSEVSEVEVDEEAQMLNPELIGAHKALNEGDLEKYALIMTGQKNFDLEPLIK